MFNFLSRGQLESLSLDKFFLHLFKTLQCFEIEILVTLVFPLLLECSAEIMLLLHVCLKFTLTNPVYGSSSPRS